MAEPTWVCLSSDMDCRGVLACLDGYMNIPLKTDGSTREWAVEDSERGYVYSSKHATRKYTEGNDERQQGLHSFQSWIFAFYEIFFSFLLFSLMILD